MYFDVENNRLLSKVPEDTPILEIELQRIEMRVAKPLMPESEANEDREKAGDELETTLKSVSLDSPEVD